jgi:hypothetical protein
MRKIFYIGIMSVGTCCISEGMNIVSDMQINFRMPGIQMPFSGLAEDDRPLSPKSMYDRGSELILSDDKKEQEHGALLILKSARDGCSDAINHFSLSCNIQKIEEWSDWELLQALLEIASRE